MMFRFWSRAYVRHLEAEVEWLRTEAQKARQDAQIARAELVRIATAGQANVAPRPLMADREQDVTQELEALRQSPEWAQVGS